MLAAVSSMLYLTDVRLFIMEKPHQGFLAISVIGAVTSRREQSNGFWFEEFFAKHADAIVNASRKTSILSISIKSRLKI